MKKTLLALVAAFSSVFFISCDKEVEVRTAYQFNVDYNIESAGMDVGVGAETITMSYFEGLQWTKLEYEDNDASSKKKAADQNDREALEEFEEDFGKYNQQVLYASYAASEGITLVTGTVTYTVTRLKNDYRDELLLGTKEIKINWQRQ